MYASLTLYMQKHPDELANCSVLLSKLVININNHCPHVMGIKCMSIWETQAVIGLYEFISWLVLAIFLVYSTATAEKKQMRNTQHVKFHHSQSRILRTWYCSLLHTSNYQRKIMYHSKLRIWYTFWDRYLKMYLKMYLKFKIGRATLLFFYIDSIYHEGAYHSKTMQIWYPFCLQ